PLVYPPLCSLSLLPAPATTVFSTLSLHDALPISIVGARDGHVAGLQDHEHADRADDDADHHQQPCRKPAVAYRLLAFACHLQSRDRKSTRLNSSHVSISYAVFCLKKKTNK